MVCLKSECTDFILTIAVYLDESGTTTANSERTTAEINPDVLMDEEIVGA